MAERNANEYIHNLARTLMGECGIRGVDWMDHKNWPSASRDYGVDWVSSREDAFIYTRYRRTLARTLWHRYHAQVLTFVSRQKKGLQGFIACCGPMWESNAHRTSILDVLQHEYKTERGGEYIVSWLAVLAIIAAMTDNLIADIRKCGNPLQQV